MTPTYTVSRLNGSTYLVIHNDKFIEFPYIYIKVYPNRYLAVVIDTGCGSNNAKGTRGKKELKRFIETNILNQYSPNQDDTYTWRFVVICTHCHFDHIGGIEAFATSGAGVIASSYDKDFLSPENLPANSFCEAFGLDTPKYTITHFAGDGEKVHHKGLDLGLTAIHTPGHTPDSLAIYDTNERWLFTGDAFYQRVALMPWGEEQDEPILFPSHGNWHDWICSVRRLLTIAEQEDAKGEPLRIACGHTTAGVLAADFLRRVKTYGGRIMRGEVPVVSRLPGDKVAPGGSLGEGMFVMWRDEGEPEFSLCAPERFEDEFIGSRPR